ncbi:hypothetical protein DFQ30_000218, partial [Apophysomyces sp. BC1015]
TDHRILLRPGKTYTVGRRDTDIVLSDDKSVSRTHASIDVEPTDYDQTINVNCRPTISIRDQSKYGTYINEELHHNSSVFLHEHDIVKFGTLNSLLRLRWVPMIVCRSSLNRQNKEELFRYAYELGFKITKDWEIRCTHLYAVTIRMSLKVVYCLLGARPIISKEYLETIRNTKDDGFHMPTDSMLPPIDSSFQGAYGEPDFTPQPYRQTLFSDIEFVLFEEVQLNRVKTMVELSDGIVTLANLDNGFTTDDILRSNRVIVSPKTADMDNAAWRKIVKVLSKCNKRPICEDEIGWAIVYSSTDKLANMNMPLSLDPTSQENLENSTQKLTEVSPAIKLENETNSQTYSEETRISPSIKEKTSVTGIPSTTATLNSRTRETSERPTATTTNMSLEDIFDDFIGDNDPLPPPSQREASPVHSGLLKSNVSPRRTTLQKRPHSIHDTDKSLTSSTGLQQPKKKAALKGADVETRNVRNDIRVRQDKRSAEVAGLDLDFREAEELDEEEAITPGKKYLKFELEDITVTSATISRVKSVDSTGANITNSKRFRKASATSYH